MPRSGTDTSGVDELRRRVDWLTARVDGSASGGEATSSSGGGGGGSAHLTTATIPKTSDATSALQSLFNEAANEGKDVLVLEGSYPIKSGPLTVPNGLTIRGVSQEKSVFTTDGDESIDLLELSNTSNVTIENLKLTHGIDLSNYGDKNFNGQAINVDKQGGGPGSGTSKNVTIRGCLFEKTARQAIAAFDRCINWLVTENEFRDVGRAGAAGVFKNSRFADNHFLRTGDDAIGLLGQGANPNGDVSDSVTIVGNTFVDSGTAYLNNSEGETANGAAVRLTGDGHVIVGNEMTGSRRYHIIGWSGPANNNWGADSGRWQITGNTFGPLDGNTSLSNPSCLRFSLQGEPHLAISNNTSKNVSKNHSGKVPYILVFSLDDDAIGGSVTTDNDETENNTNIEISTGGSGFVRLANGEQVEFANHGTVYSCANTGGFTVGPNSSGTLKLQNGLDNVNQNSPDVPMGTDVVQEDGVTTGGVVELSDEQIDDVAKIIVDRSGVGRISVQDVDVTRHPSNEDLIGDFSDNVDRYYISGVSVNDCRHVFNLTHDYTDSARNLQKTRLKYEPCDLPASASIPLRIGNNRFYEVEAVSSSKGLAAFGLRYTVKVDQRSPLDQEEVVVDDTDTPSEDAIVGLVVAGSASQGDTQISVDAKDKTTVNLVDGDKVRFTNQTAFYEHSGTTTIAPGGSGTINLKSGLDTALPDGSADIDTSATASSGDSVIQVTDQGNGTELSEGDVVSFSGHAAEYIVKSRLSLDSSSGDLEIKSKFDKDITSGEDVTLVGAQVKEHEGGIKLTTDILDAQRGDERRTLEVKQKTNRTAFLRAARLEALGGFGVQAISKGNTGFKFYDAGTDNQIKWDILALFSGNDNLTLNSKDTNGTRRVFVALEYPDGEIVAKRVLRAAEAIKFNDTQQDPAANGVIRRNGSDLKVYSGGAVRNLTEVGQSQLDLEINNTDEATDVDVLDLNEGSGITLSGSAGDDSGERDVTIDLDLDVEDSGANVIGAHGINFGSNLNVTDDGDGTVTVDGTGVSPAGSTGHVQLRGGGGNFDSDIDLVWDFGSSALEVGGSSTAYTSSADVQSAKNLGTEELELAKNFNSASSDRAKLRSNNGDLIYEDPSGTTHTVQSGSN